MSLLNNKPKISRRDFPLSKLPSTFPTEIDESLSLGLDLGVGSCGQALVYESAKDKSKCQLKGLPEFPGPIAFLGVRAFEVAETNTQTGIKLKNPERREKRLMRRTIRRRAWRMWEVRKLLHGHGLLPANYPLDKKIWKTNPPRGENPDLDSARDWHSRMTPGSPGEGSAGPLAFRVEGLDRKLEHDEFAAALLHIAKHRGFKSSKKGESLDEEGGKVLKALSESARKISEKGYRTYAELILKDQAFSKRTRNTDGDYSATPLRAQLVSEIELLFQSQREFKNTKASIELENAFQSIFGQQKGLQNSFNLLGDCPFFPKEKRGSRYAYSFELSRALQKLNTFTVTVGGVKHRLAEYVNASEGGYNTFISSFSGLGTASNPGRITWKDLRRIFNFGEEVVFNDLPTPKLKKKKGEEVIESVDELEKTDFVTRNNSNAAAKGSYLLRMALGDDLWEEMVQKKHSQIDKVASALSFFEEIENDFTDQKHWGVLNELEFQNVDKRLYEAVKSDLTSTKPTLAKFTGAVSLSSRASRDLIPELAKGLVYSEACQNAFGKLGEADFALESVTNPVVVSVVRECLKQVVHLIDEAGSLPGKIVVELARDMGKSTNERDEITAGLKKRTDQRNANRKNLEGHLCRKPSDDELLRYELWLEQDNLCPYCGEVLGRPEQIVESDFEVDHIIPRSRSHDNSYNNRVLVHRKCNQGKQNQTPFEWAEIGGGDEHSIGWREYTTRVSAMRRIRKEKRRHLLNSTFGDDEAAFASRHLKDTQYIARLVTHHLESLYTVINDHKMQRHGGTRRVFAQPGSLTALVRKSWGLEGLKKDREGRRIGDKHHAVDALVCALLSEGQRQFATRLEKRKREIKEVHNRFSDFTRIYKLMENENDHHFVPRRVNVPWKGFRDDVVKGLALFTVSRSENRKGRGQLHDETIYRVEHKKDKDIYYSRKNLIDRSKGKAKGASFNIDDVKDIDLKINLWLRNALEEWVKNKRPVEEEWLPKDPQGCIIRKVTIEAGSKSGRKYPQGYVLGGTQIRVDVYSQVKSDNKKVYDFVPIYSHQLSEEAPPKKYIKANEKEHNWNTIGEGHSFEFSLWKNSRILIDLGHGPFECLFLGIDRATAAVSWANPDDSSQSSRSSKKDMKVKPVSIRTKAKQFFKLSVDRLGRTYKVTNEKLTWRGGTF